MLYVKRAASGEVVAVSKIRPADELTADWSELVEDDPVVRAFGIDLLGRTAELAAADLDFIRVLEDLIELLQGKGVIAFTDLPASAQEKLLGRRKTRASMHGLKLVNDGEEEEIPLRL